MSGQIKWLVLAGLMTGGIVGTNGWGLMTASAVQTTARAQGKSFSTTNAAIEQVYALVRSNQFEEACRMCDEIIRRGGKDRDIQEAFYRKGVCLQAMKKDQEAIACWKTLLARYTDTEWDDDALMEMGKTYALSLNQPEKALPCYERLIRDHPRS